MPRLVSAAPTFLVDDVEGTALWYQHHLGFSASFYPRERPHFFCSICRDGVEVMLLRQQNYRKPEIQRPGGVWDAYIRMENVREFYDDVRQRTPLKSELVKRPYGDWEFEVADPNGYVLVFGE
jgi:hypothetical protein